MPKSSSGTHKQRPSKSPKLRHAMKRAAEQDERKAKPGLADPKPSVKETFKRG